MRRFIKIFFKMSVRKLLKTWLSFVLVVVPTFFLHGEIVMLVYKNALFCYYVYEYFFCQLLFLNNSFYNLAVCICNASFY